ncbi:MAG: hypothetical protein QFB87_04645 [Patescibacteria group bacterium]|nr:hypothetical protein [Patescibacteria group bacterium]
MSKKTDNYFIEIDNRHGNRGRYVQITLPSSTRGLECYEDELDTLVAAIQEAKLQLTDLVATDKDASND